MKTIAIRHLRIGHEQPFALIAGPCVIESESLVMETAEVIKQITDELKIPFIFKSSYTKANRQHISSFTGPGLKNGLKILAKVKNSLDLPVLTDIHHPEEAAPVAEVADILQIPAFLCRQTDIVIAAAQTGRPVNIKKGQFMAPDDMGSIVGKAKSTGNEQILLTERGTTFGYHNLVVDFRSLTIMRRLGYPVVFDATHSLQLPGGKHHRSGGQPEFIFPMARAALAVGCDAIFLETHPCVDEALCDGANMLALQRLKSLLEQLLAIQSVRQHSNFFPADELNMQS